MVVKWLTSFTVKQLKSDMIQQTYRSILQISNTLCSRKANTSAIFFSNCKSKLSCHMCALGKGQTENIQFFCSERQSRFDLLVFHPETQLPILSKTLLLIGHNSKFTVLANFLWLSSTAASTWTCKQISGWRRGLLSPGHFDFVMCREASMSERLSELNRA